MFMVSLYLLTFVSRVKYTLDTYYRLYFAGIILLYLANVMTIHTLDLSKTNLSELWNGLLLLEETRGKKTFEKLIPIHYYIHLKINKINIIVTINIFI